MAAWQQFVLYGVAFLETCQSLSLQVESHPFNAGRGWVPPLTGQHSKRAKMYRDYFDKMGEQDEPEATDSSSTKSEKKQLSKTKTGKGGKAVVHISTHSQARTAEKFAETAKTELFNGTGPLPLFVIGNEAGDMDTIVSSLAVAYVLSADDESTAKSIPVMPFTRAEFRLRKDAVMLFTDAGWRMDSEGAPEALTFWDEMDWSAVEARGNATDSRPDVVLTDHNKMSETSASHFVKVRRIVDHHMDEGLYKHVQNFHRNIEEKCRSCCTLAAGMVDRKGMPKDLGTLLLGTILVDTRYTNWEKMKISKSDESAVYGLEAFAPATFASDEAPLATWYDRLVNARFETSAFSADDLLKLDYKEAQVPGSIKVGFSTILTDVDDLKRRAGGAEELLKKFRDYAKSRDRDVLLVTTKKDSGIKMFNAEENKTVFIEGNKTLLIAAVDENENSTSTMAAQEIMQFLQEVPHGLPSKFKTDKLFVTQGVPDKGFGLVPLPQHAPLTAFSFRGSATRKTIMPAVVEFVKERIKVSDRLLRVKPNHHH